jgi:hypothetical protein
VTVDEVGDDSGRPSSCTVASNCATGLPVRPAGPARPSDDIH